MSSEDMDKRKQKYLSFCICDKCPRWIECGEKGDFGLAPNGKNSCIKEEMGFTFVGCPVTEKLEFMYMYY